MKKFKKGELIVANRNLSYIGSHHNIKKDKIYTFVKYMTDGRIIIAEKPISTYNENHFESLRNVRKLKLLKLNES